MRQQCLKSFNSFVSTSHSKYLTFDINGNRYSIEFQFFCINKSFKVPKPSKLLEYPKVSILLYQQVIQSKGGLDTISHLPKFQFFCINKSFKGRHADAKHDDEEFQFFCINKSFKVLKANEKGYLFPCFNSFVSTSHSK